MRFLSLLLSSLLLCALSATAHGAPEPLKADFDVVAAIDANGRVTGLEFGDDTLHPAIRAPLERAMRGWEFEPAQVDGVAAPSLTHLSITVLAEPVDDDGDAYALRVTRASNGPAIESGPPPKYPLAAIRSHTSARLLLDVAFDARGRVIAASLASVEARRGSKRSVDLLVRESLQSVRDWTFRPEQVAGQPVGARIQVPISFCVGPTRARGTCFSEEELARDEAVADLPPSSEDRLIAEHPVTRLKSDVVGRLL